MTSTFQAPNSPMKRLDCGGFRRRRNAISPLTGMAVIEAAGNHTSSLIAQSNKMNHHVAAQTEYHLEIIE